VAKLLARKGAAPTAHIPNGMLLLVDTEPAPPMKKAPISGGFLFSTLLAYCISGWLNVSHTLIACSVAVLSAR